METLDMANEAYGRTNQKLYFASLALQRARQAEQGGALEQPGLLRAAREEALFHLQGALLGLCQEVGRFYRWPDANQGRVEAFLQLDRARLFPSPELGELMELARQPDTWLARLQVAHGALFAPSKDSGKDRQVPTGLIEAVNVEDQSKQEPSLEDLQQWRQDMQSLVRRFRQGMSEF